ncbi:inorganic phosphate transporter family protein [Candidatus Bipolaricaulota bacterium]|nr:inorganic phosphate transporter family protein [Candidatus Bipolaricaulota bacterium]
MWTLLPAILMGWSLGANDAANVFGLAVGVRAVRYLVAITLTATFALLGAYLGGAQGMATYSSVAAQSLASSFCVALAAGLTVAGMTWRGLPVSTTQAAVGAIIGVALVSGRPVQWSVLGKIVISWVASPLGAMVVAYLAHRFVSPLLENRLGGVVLYDRIVRFGIVGIGIWGAYALGANNVANVTGVYVGAGLLSVPMATLIGGGSIALGVLAFSRRVMETVGERLVPLGPLPALLAVAAQAASLQLFAILGVPVSASQAVVGAVVGIGLVKGVETVNRRQLLGIALGWALTPTLSGLVGALLWVLLGGILPG